MPRKLPPASDCARPGDGADASKPHIQSPLAGAAYVLRLNDHTPPEIPHYRFCSTAAAHEVVIWFCG